jgi:hypothetical protein
MESPQPKNDELETVSRTVTVKLPKDYDTFLVGLTTALHIKVEHLLLEEIYATLENFFDGGFYEGWTEQLMTKQMNENEKVLQKQVSQVADIALGC